MAWRRFRHLSVQRVLAKLQAALYSEDYYEAHQIYRTLYCRFLAQRKYLETLDLLYTGASLLLQREQHASGADLAIEFAELLAIAKMPPVQKFFERVTNLFTLMSPTSPERDHYTQVALKWSKKGSSFETGHPDLHRAIAQVFWKEKNYVMARKHFINSKDGSGCAAMLVELHEQHGYSNEIDLFITHAVLQYLSMQNKAAAHEAFHSYTSQHPKINSGPPYLLPLLNFLFFLFQAIDIGKLSVFTVLCEQYQISLDRDPCLWQHIEKIGQLFFNVTPPRPLNQGLLGSLMQSFFNHPESDDSDEEQRNTPSTSHMVQELD